MHSLISGLFLTALFISSACLALTVEAKQRFATLDWTVAETLIALGEEPVAVGDKKSYTQWVEKPELPQNTLDLGVRMQPNLELLIPLINPQHAEPLIFINTRFYASATSTISQFAQQVKIVDFYNENDIWAGVLSATRKIADIIEKPEAYHQLMANYQTKLNEIRPHLKTYISRPIALVQFIDSRHLRIYAQNSLFGAVLKNLGFQNAWNRSHNQWGFETIDLTQLATLPQQTRLVVIKPYPASIRSALKYNTLWQHLHMTKDPIILPTLWSFGGVLSAQRFAEALEKGLQAGSQAW